jgi:hypothetical protein
MKKFLCFICLLSPFFVNAELSALVEEEMQAVSGKGIRIDANVDFARNTAYSYTETDWSVSASDDTWVSYAKIMVDEQGRVLSDATTGIDANDGYINYDPASGKTGNVKRQDKDILNGYSAKYLNEATGDYLIRKPYYMILGEISGGISFSGLELEFVSDFGINKNRAALKWTLPDKIVFNQFEISGLYISEDEFISRDDTKLLGARFDGPIYLPSTPDAYVFVTSD